MLQEVKRILETSKINYKVVISPLYEQMKFSNQDYAILKNLFRNNLYDFSGKKIPLPNQKQTITKRVILSRLWATVFLILFIRLLLK